MDIGNIEPELAKLQRVADNVRDRASVRQCSSPVDAQLSADVADLAEAVEALVVATREVWRSVVVVDGLI
jgi:hypothetical protein